MRSYYLKLVNYKSGAVLLIQKWAFVTPQLTIGGHLISFCFHAIFLGVIFDKRLTFQHWHVKTVAAKVSKSAMLLNRLMPSIGSPYQWRRKLLSTVVESQLLNATPV